MMLRRFIVLNLERITRGCNIVKCADNYYSFVFQIQNTFEYIIGNETGFVLKHENICLFFNKLMFWALYRFRLTVLVGPHWFV